MVALATLVIRVASRVASRDANFSNEKGGYKLRTHLKDELTKGEQKM